jgi:DNA-binding MarR family transcriptional regulator
MVTPMELQTLIHDLGHSQNWVARQIDIDKATFSRIVRGLSALDARKVEPLAAVLRVPVARVLSALRADATGDRA